MGVQRAEDDVGELDGVLFEEVAFGVLVGGFEQGEAILVVEVQIEGSRVRESETRTVDWTRRATQRLPSSSR